jgi:hypothetical protein
MATVATARSNIPKFRYLSAWFCPYAHRATIALEHHAERVQYEWVEVRGCDVCFLNVIRPLVYVTVDNDSSR